MARIFPLRTEPTTGDGTPRVVDLDDEEADAVFGALSSDTARRIYAALEEEPGTPSDVAEAVDSSIQNVRYHLEKLEGAGLIEVVDTWYSSRGNEMDVYAAADGPLIVTSDRSRASRLRDALSRYAGGVALLAGLSFFVQVALTRSFPLGFPSTPDDDAADADEPDMEPTAGETAEEHFVADETDADAADDGEYDDAADTSEEPPDDDLGDEDLEAEEVEDAETADDVDTADSENLAEPGDADDDLVTVDESDALSEESEYTGTDDIARSAEESAGPEVFELFAGGLPPGLLFFLGGLVVLTLVLGYWYWSTQY